MPYVSYDHLFRYENGIHFNKKYGLCLRACCVLEYSWTKLYSVHL